MKTFRTLITIGLAGATLAVADVPTTSPVRLSGVSPRPSRSVAGPTTAPTRNDALQQFRERMARFREAMNGVEGGNNQQSPGADEWKNIAAFNEQNFPNRWKMFQKIEKSRGDDSAVVQNIKLKLALKYRGMMKAQDDMPDVYSIALDQGKMEDDAWGTLLEVRRDPNNTELQSKLRDKVTALVNAILDERENRLQTLSNIVQQQQEQLEDSRQNMDRLIDRQMGRLMGDNPFGGPGPGFGGPGGFDRGPGFNGRRRLGGPPSDHDGDRQGQGGSQSAPDQPVADQVNTDQSGDKAPAQ